MAGTFIMNPGPDAPLAISTGAGAGAVDGAQRLTVPAR